MPPRASVTVSTLVLLVVGCGARTGLRVDDQTASDASPPDLGSELGSEVPELPGCYGGGTVVLASGEVAPTFLAIDSEHVYWTSAGSDCSSGVVRRVSKRGGPVETLSSDEPDPRVLATDGTRVYWYDGCGTGKVRATPVAGGAIDELPARITKGSTTNVVGVDGRFVYFNDYGLVAIPKGGGAQRDIDNAGYVYGLAVDSSGAYWTGLVSDSSGGYAVRGYDPVADRVVILDKPTEVSGAIAVDDASVYYVVSDSNIVRVSKKGGSPTTVVDGATLVVSLAADAESLYWIEGGYSLPSSIVKMPKGGGTRSVLASDLKSAFRIAVDERCAYWIEGAFGYGDGRIVRAPK